ncbi:CAP domain-containing protein [Saccharopolyspora indica]|uniref:CAP domain-containing protein n=1 Tax=Saccharopolyspora indica TaxID=1229659 RepID=UPI0022EB8780|nr:CAP domain-containing protein [Saccharopolyspora indica]MDA3647134.1 CAP domain-containing protein [Saccharopolyspora indica]
MKTPTLRRSVITATALLIGVGSAAWAPAAMASGSIEDQVVALVNQARAEAGCKAVKVDSRLTKAAAEHSADMASRSYLDHTNPDGETFSQRIKEAGHPSPGAENIAQGYSSAAEAMDGWLKSEGHKANIVNCSMKTIGVAVNGDYWTQDFGR